MLAGLSRASPSLFHVVLDGMARLGVEGPISKTVQLTAGKLMQSVSWKLSPVSWGPEFLSLWTSPLVLRGP